VKRFSMRMLIAWGAAAAFAVCLPACQKDSASASSKGGGRSRAGMSFPVEVEQVEAHPIVFTVNAVGSVEAFEKVQVTARVAGAVDSVLFSEGSFARENQVLVEIETERYKLAVESARAALEKAEAGQADAEAGVKRREAVVSQTPGLIPTEEIETWRTKVRVAASDVAEAKAALNQAELNLRDAYVHAPISGIIQTRTVQTGEYVQVGTVLATLVRRDPLLVRFKIAERDAMRIKPGMKAIFKVRDDPREYEAKIVHVAASAEEATRLVEVTGQVNDPNEKALRPGSFAEVSVPVGSEASHPIVPLTAVRPSEQGFLAFVVGRGTASSRVLTLGMRTPDGQVEVLSGLNTGDSLVVRGGESLRDGAPIRIVAAGQAPGASAPGEQVHEGSGAAQSGAGPAQSGAGAPK
jgi:multidrug efflux system membrane fusion protein